MRLLRRAEQSPRWGLIVASNEGRCRGAVAVNGETRIRITQKEDVATLTVGAKAEHSGPMFHNLGPVHPSHKI